jgi:hypothetical protein
LRRSHAGIQLVEHFDVEDGATVFANACRLGLEGIASKRRDMPYQHGPQSRLAQNQEPGQPGDETRLEGPVLVTSAGVVYEIRVDGAVRVHCDDREIAIEAARYLQQRTPAAAITITDLRDGSTVPFVDPPTGQRDMAVRVRIPGRSPATSAGTCEQLSYAYVVTGLPTGLKGRAGARRL